ncbi:hypothetical protein ILUMI_06022 [Ignelater luminosus]|uniref:Uncharacterized protein n=1 Tax=Ignelater luminosus TaxID=2038154 RepID=A0A8K0D622_IGNLU|nr:hypothetical protein ILUMI_06022 [Ignelater luminosus]
MDSFALSPLQPLNLTGNTQFFRTEAKIRDEPFEDYFTAIINLGLQCDLGALKEELTKAKIISGLDSKYDDLRTRLMAEEDKTLTLSYVTKYLKTAESSRQAVTQMQKDNHLFDGKLGSIPGTVSITLDSNAKPVAQPARHIPFGLIDDVKAELARMVTDGVIEPITKPTKWTILDRSLNRPLNKVPPRLQRMMLAVQGFDLHVVYKPGKELFIADALSRAFVDEPVEKEFYTLNEEVICQVNALIENLPIADRILDKIKNETCKDTELIELKKYITAGWPDNKNKLNQIINPYWTYKKELHIIDEILTRDDPWLVLMEYRNTPKEHMPSPAQLLYSRNLRTRIPVRSEDLKPKVYRLPEKFVRHQDTVKKYYDKRTRSLQPLREGQNIRFQKHQSGHWCAGKVKGKGPQPRSYQVRDHSGNLFTRNRVMINPSPRQSSPTPATPPTNSTLEFPQTVQIHQQIGDSTLQETAEGKAVKNLDNKITRSGPESVSARGQVEEFWMYFLRNLEVGWKAKTLLFIKEKIIIIFHYTSPKGAVGRPLKTALEKNRKQRVVDLVQECLALELTFAANVALRSVGKINSANVLVEFF